MGDAIDGAGPLPAQEDADGSIKRDISEVWFEDGNTVVIGQNTAFRFHKSVVSIHSSVFCDLFSIPRPSPKGEEVDETFDGCPVVRVSDTSYDFRELIRAIYGGVNYLRPEQVVTFPVLAALARLSHKYQLHQLLAAAIHRLKGTFATQLDVYERSGGFSTRSPLKLRRSDAIEALNLFRLLDRPEMIPVALYECCQYGPAFLLQGITRLDGITRENLSPSDLELCFRVTTELVRATVCLLTELCESYTARLLGASTSPDCSSPGLCLNGLKILLDRCWHDYLVDCIFPDPFGTMYVALVDNILRDKELVRGACEDVFRAEYSQLRKDVWASLRRLMEMGVAEWDSA